jgi:hypothetical protein
VRIVKPSRAFIGAAFLLSLWLVIAALAANTVWVTISAQPEGPAPQQSLSDAGAPVAARAPYTVILQESTQGPDGVVSPQGTMTLALRSDGAYLVQYEHLGTPFVLLRTIELPTGETVVADDIRERRTTTKIRPGSSQRARMDPRQGCIKNDIGEPVFPGKVVGNRDRVAGYDTVRVLAGTSTLWFSRQLGCAQVKASTPMPTGGVNEKIPTWIYAGEPDAALFYVPDRYQEVPPSVFQQLNPNSREAHAADRFYFQRRPGK